MTVQIGDVVGDYKVIGVAGSGGMGAVYKIEHIITKRIEAMKLLPPALNSEPEQVQRFEREIQVQARLHHPNIVTLYNAIRNAESIALVMEFVEGESLQHMLESGPLPLKLAVNYARQVLSALAYAHDAGVIHRDVGPANIIITHDGIAKLTDFGLARAETDLRLTSSGVPVGSPWYMSPEQVRGVGIIDGRTDLYAVGAVLHEMLTGVKLFDVGGAFAVMRAQVEAVPELPSSRNAAVPAGLDEIVRRALAKNQAERFQSADEFRLALEKVSLERAYRPAPVAVAPPPPVEPDNTEVLLVPVPPAAWRVRGLHTLRTAMLMAVVPAILVAGIYAVQKFPKRTARPEPVKQPTAVTVPQVPQAAPAAEPTPSPALPPATETRARVAVLPPAAPVPSPAAATLPPAAIATRVAPTPQKAVQTPARNQRPAAPERYSLQVTGAEVMPSAPAPVHKPPTAAAAPPSPASPDTVELPPAKSGPAILTPVPELETPGQEAGPAKPAKGNRLVRALGKINPFKKDEAGDSAKPPAKKD